MSVTIGPLNHRHMSSTHPPLLATSETTMHPEFDPRADVHRIEHESESPWPVSTTIVLALSSLTGIEPTAMLPLYRAVDPDALSHHVQGRDRDAELSFEHHGYQVTVRGDGHIEITSNDSQ